MSESVALWIATFVGVLTVAAISSELTFWVVRRFDFLDDQISTLSRRLIPIERWYRSHKEGAKDE